MKGHWEYLENKRILITGGTGSLGHQLRRDILAATQAARVIILSRDEFKQYRMQEELSEDGKKRTGFFLGGVQRHSGAVLCPVCCWHSEWRRSHCYTDDFCCFR
ncbi:MAG: KR domain-containing protein [Verrucomicrobiae bacterium]|nr:KR domain-containing protein [Verrucomicrobiae bacterium]